MKDDIKLVAAFLSFNAGVFLLIIGIYVKGGMHIGAVLQHLGH